MHKVEYIWRVGSSELEPFTFDIGEESRKMKQKPTPTTPIKQEQTPDRNTRGKATDSNNNNNSSSSTTYTSTYFKKCIKPSCRKRLDYKSKWCSDCATQQPDLEIRKKCCKTTYPGSALVCETCGKAF